MKGKLLLFKIKLRRGPFDIKDQVKYYFRIGFEIARRLGHEGAKVVVSSRKQKNVDEACKKLENEGLDIFGMVCHVGKNDDRKNLVNKVFLLIISL